jgi:DNA ligase-1
VKLFTELFIRLDETNKTAQKVAAMEEYFRRAPAIDAAWGLFFLSGLRLRRTVKTAVVRAAAVAATGVPEWMLAECHGAVGDLSETIALLLPEAAAKPFDEPLHRVVDHRIKPLVNSPDALAATSLIEAWSLMDRNERLVFNKLVRGNFRVGVQRALVVRALAAAHSVDPAVVTHRLTGPYEPTEAGFTKLVSPGSSVDDAARPYPFCLAQQLDVVLAELGDPSAWQAEYKWDGIRAQIVRREALCGGVAIWSRGEEPIASQFPEIATAAARVLPVGTVIDGEVLAWKFRSPWGPGAGGDDGKPLSFNALQTRLNRKRVHPTLFDAEGVVFAAFDLLEHEGKDIRALPLRERRSRLDSMMRAVQEASGGVLRLPPEVIAATWEDREVARAKARDEYGAEGLMLKHLDSSYHAGRAAGSTLGTIARNGAAGGGWWKWKVDPYSVDAVLMYAQQGSGRRTGLYTDYTFGVWDPDPSGALTPFAKAYSGLDNEKIKRVDAFIRANSVDRAGPVRMVSPKLVFEISFEGIQESPRHRSGIAVRFPRITRWRTDKTPEQADTISTVRALLNAARVRDGV